MSRGKPRPALGGALGWREGGLSSTSTRTWHVNQDHQALGWRLSSNSARTSHVNRDHQGQGVSVRRLSSICAGAPGLEFGGSARRHVEAGQGTARRLTARTARRAAGKVAWRATPEAAHETPGTMINCTTHTAQAATVAGSFRARGTLVSRRNQTTVTGSFRARGTGGSTWRMSPGAT